jgi:hypothetical protein
MRVASSNAAPPARGIGTRNTGGGEVVSWDLCVASHDSNGEDAYLVLSPVLKFFIAGLQRRWSFDAPREALVSARDPPGGPLVFAPISDLALPAARDKLENDFGAAVQSRPAVFLRG